MPASLRVFGRLQPLFARCGRHSRPGSSHAPHAVDAPLVGQRREDHLTKSHCFLHEAQRALNLKEAASKGDTIPFRWEDRSAKRNLVLQPKRLFFCRAALSRIIQHSDIELLTGKGLRHRKCLIYRIPDAFTDHNTITFDAVISLTK
jgi:hypothetical protein